MLPPDLPRRALAKICHTDARAVAALRPCRRVPRVPRAKAAAHSGAPPPAWRLRDLVASRDCRSGSCAATSGRLSSGEVWAGTRIPYLSSGRTGERL